MVNVQKLGEIMFNCRRTKDNKYINNITIRILEVTSGVYTFTRKVQLVNRPEFDLSNKHPYKIYNW